jgi:hypothetical protein
MNPKVMGGRAAAITILRAETYNKLIIINKTLGPVMLGTGSTGASAPGININ